MRTLLALALLSVVVAPTLKAADEDYIYDKDVQTLIKTVHFGFGPVALSRSITEGEAALKRILKKSDAIRYLFPVFDKATIEGKCFALVGFRLLAPEYFESSCARIERMSDMKVNTVAGCLVGEHKLYEVIRAIREGQYDDDALGRNRG